MEGLSYNSNRTWSMMITITLGMFIYGYNIGILNPCLPSIEATLAWGSLTTTYSAIASTFLVLGSFTGCLMAGSMSNRYGRRKVLLATNILNAVGVLCTMIPQTYLLFLGRYINGASCGFYSCIIPVFISELSPVQISGKIGSLNQIMISAGILFAYALGLILPVDTSDPLNWWWVGMMGIQIIPIIIMFYVLAFKIKVESPSWLQQMGREQESREVYSYIYNCDHAGVQLEAFDSLLSTDTGTQEEPSYKELLTNRRYSKMMMLGSNIMIIQQMVGPLAILFYSTVMFIEINGSVMTARILTVVMGMIQLLALYPSSLILDRTGRKKMMAVGCLVLFFNMLALGIIQGFFPALYMVAIILIMMYFIIGAFSFSSIAWLYCGEVCTDKANSFCVAVNNICGIIVGVSLPYIVQYVGLQYAFWGYGLVALYGAIWSALVMVETKGLTRQQIMARIVGGDLELKQKDEKA